MDVIQHLREHDSSWISLKKAVVWIVKVKHESLCQAKRREQGADIAQYDTGEEQQKR